MTTPCWRQRDPEIANASRDFACHHESGLPVKIHQNTKIMEKIKAILRKANASITLSFCLLKPTVIANKGKKNFYPRRLTSEIIFAGNSHEATQAIDDSAFISINGTKNEVELWITCYTWKRMHATPSRSTNRVFLVHRDCAVLSPNFPHQGFRSRWFPQPQFRSDLSRFTIISRSGSGSPQSHRERINAQVYIHSSTH